MKTEVSRHLRLTVAGTAMVLVCAGFCAAEDKPAKTDHAWDGGNPTPFHLLQLKGEDDLPIIPTETAPFPFSARYTCGPCHDYATISGGLHFNAIAAKSQAGRRGEPWFLTDSRTGTSIPVSYRGWAGTFAPARLGLTAWDMTILFGRSMPGGGPADPPSEMTSPDPAARWSVSGKAEVNCLACHNASPRQDQSEWAKQVMRENLRWAATAAAGLGEVGGMASRLGSTWDIYDGPNPDDHEWAVAPSVKYEPADFDSKHRYRFDVSYQPDNKRCLACHSTATDGEAHMDSEQDVHLAAGLKCVDCHRNDLGHDMVRGYEGEAAEKGRRELAGFTCRGCHLGEDSEGNPTVTPGRLGAPYPKHVGIPLVHFKQLACTVCHSGPVLGKSFTRVRTSRSNRLGIYGVADWTTDLPVIYEPVYSRQDGGKITPHRLTWPSYWARVDGKELVPLKPEEVAAAAGQVLMPEDHVAAVLTALTNSTEEGETPVLIAGDHMFELNADVGLDAVPYKGGRKEPWHWAVLKESVVTRYVPDFDPDSQDKDPNVEARVQNALTALSTVPGLAGQPVFIMGKTLYRLTDGNLETAAVPEGTAKLKGFLLAVKNGFEPLVSEYDVRTVSLKAGGEPTLTEEQVALVLRALAGKAGKTAHADGFAYVCDGRMFRLNGKGRLAAEKRAEAGPVMWPMAHNVRPAQQSLGRDGKCSDCHSAGSGFFFTRLEGRGSLLTKKEDRRSSASYMGTAGLFQRTFGLTFIVRPLLKIVLIFCALIIGALFLIAGLQALTRISGMSERK